MINISTLTLIGAIIAALGTLWQAYQNNRSKAVTQITPKSVFYFPSVVVFIGAFIVSISVWMASEQKQKQDKLISAKDDYIKSLSDSIFAKSSSIESMSKEIITLNQEVNKLQTGGNGFCFVGINSSNDPDAKGIFMLYSKGQYPQYDIKVVVLDLSKAPPSYEVKDLAELGAMQLKGDMGTLGPNTNRIVGQLALNEKGFNVGIDTRAAHFDEALRLKRINGQWRIAFRVYKWLDNTSPTVKKKEIFSFREPEYPLEAFLRIDFNSW